MFTCIEFLPEKEGFFTKIYEKIKQPQPEREYVQVKGATAFLRLVVREDYADWCEISSCLRGNERVVLLSHEKSLPDGISLKRYEPVSLGMVLIFRTLCHVLKIVNEPEKLNLSVFDENAVLSPMIDKIAPLVRNACVYTEKVDSYFCASARVMKNSGMNIKIGEYETERKSHGIVISDKYLPSLKEADFIFLAGSDTISYNTVTGEGIFLEDKYKILKSPDIDDFSFASALYEKNNASVFAEKDFSSIYFAGKAVSEDELACLIRQKML